MWCVCVRAEADFSTNSKTDYSGLVLVGGAVLVLLALLGYFLTQGSQK